MKLSVVKVDSSGDHNIRVVCRDSNTKERHILMVRDFLPYFYVQQKDMERAIREWKPLHYEDDVRKALEDDSISLGRVYFNNTQEVKLYRTKVAKIWEADVPFTQRFIIDTGCHGTIEIPDSDKFAHFLSYRDIKHVDVEAGNLRRQYIDIEVANEKFCRPSDGTAPVCLISIYDNYTDQFYTWGWNPLKEAGRTKQEFFSRALNRFVEADVTWCDSSLDSIKQWLSWYNRNRPDVIQGWNSIEYDMQYLVNHARSQEVFDDCLGGKCGRYVDLPDVQQLDMMELYRMQSQGEMKFDSLGSVAQTECGIELVKDSDNIMKWFKTDPDALLLYNLLDVDSTVAIDRKCDLFGFAVRYMNYAGVDRLMDILAASVVVDVAHLFEAVRMGVALPSRLDRPTVEKYEGARVFEPIAGVHDNVGVFDFSRMYPSIIMGYNMSFETYGKPGITIPPSKGVKQDFPGASFSNEKTGISVRVTKHLATLRAKFDDAIDAATDPSEIKRLKNLRAPLKNMLNSIFGAMSFENYRLYKKEVAESITAVGRELINGVRETANAMGYKVVYGDTDSVFVQIGGKGMEDVMSMASSLSDELNSKLAVRADLIGIPRNQLTMDFEKLYDRLFLGNVKKRYAGRIVWQDGKVVKPWVEIKGFEYQRSESATVTVDLQERLFDMILNGKPRAEVVKYVKDLEFAVRTGSLPINVVATSPKLKVDPASYESSFMPAQAALYSNKHLGKTFNGGDRVYCVYVKYVPKGLPPTHVIGLRDKDTTVPDGFVVDWKTMTEKVVSDKALKILDVIGWGPGGKQLKLEIET